MLQGLLATPFGEFAVLLVLAASIGSLGLLLRQPLIVSFIAVGLIAGPSALNLVSSEENVELLSQLGIAVLLFLVGIKLDLKLIKSLGLVSLLTGLGQVAFTSIFGYLIGLLLGLGHIVSLYVAVALTFSSTIIIVKLLSDKREIDALHGQIALGFLIVQDIVVVVAMIVLSAIGVGAGGDSDGAGGSIFAVMLSALGFVGVVFVFIRYVADPVTSKLANAPELLMIFALALAGIFAAVGDTVGLGKEVGGLLAGVSLASTPYRETVAARLAPLRDFLLLFFFIALGATLDLSLLGENVPAALTFSLFVLMGNPLIVMIIMGALGYRKRTGFLAGLTVAQISEFSLIFIAMGVSLGHVGQDALGLVTLVGLITIAASTYMITYSHQLYSIFEPVLGIFERRTLNDSADNAAKDTERVDVILFGLGRYGTAIGTALIDQGMRVLGVDFDPRAVKAWQSKGFEGRFGDAIDAEFIEHLPLDKTPWVVSTVPVPTRSVTHEDVRVTLLQLLEKSAFQGQTAVAAHDQSDSDELMRGGADLILQPFEDAAARAVELICLPPHSKT